MSEFPVHQQRDVLPEGRLVGVAVGSLVVAVIAIFFGGLILVGNTGRLQPNAGGRGKPEVAPRELGNIEQTPIGPTEDGIDLERRQKAELGRYRWVDRDAGVVAIPIDRAIDQIVEEER